MRTAGRPSRRQAHKTETPAASSPFLDKTLPNDLDAERSVLGAGIVNNSNIAPIRELLRVQDFFLPQHAVVFARLCAMRDGDRAVDTLTLTDALRESGELAAAGGTPYIASLPDGMPKISNFRDYARIVREKARLRRVAKAADRARELALSANGNASEALKEIAELCAVDEPGGAGWRSMFHSWEEFETAPSLSFAIGGFLQNNGATMIGGLSGHGKTLILLSVVRALLAGKGARLWDLFPVEETAVRCLYLIPESTIEPFKHRLRLFGLYDYLAPNDGRLFVRTLSKGATPVLSDPRILAACKGAHVILDTAVRFSDGDENSAGDTARGLSTDIFALLGAGARSVLAAHHSPKPFAREATMRLENVLRGSGDLGAMLTTCWGVKQLDAGTNTLHIENVKPRDFQPCGPFQLIGRPFIDERQDFAILKRPGECGTLAEEQPAENQGGAGQESRQQRARRVGMAKEWLGADDALTVEQLHIKFQAAGVTVSRSAVKNYRREALQ